MGVGACRTLCYEAHYRRAGGDCVIGKLGIRLGSPIIERPDSPPYSRPEFSKYAPSECGQEAFYLASPANSRLPVQSSLLDEALDLIWFLAVIEESPRTMPSLD